MSATLTLEQMIPAARAATRAALRTKAIAAAGLESVVVSAGFEGDFGVFELYIPGERPRDAQVIARTWVHRVTGAVQVETFV